jgi:hypothetical protein
MVADLWPSICCTTFTSAPEAWTGSRRCAAARAGAARHANPPGGVGQHGALKHLRAQRTPVHGQEHQVVRLLASQVIGEGVHQEAGDSPGRPGGAGRVWGEYAQHRAHRRVLVVLTR